MIWCESSCFCSVVRVLVVTLRIWRGRPLRNCPPLSLSSGCSFESFRCPVSRIVVTCPAPSTSSRPARSGSCWTPRWMRLISSSPRRFTGTASQRDRPGCAAVGRLNRLRAVELFQRRHVLGERAGGRGTVAAPWSPGFAAPRTAAGARGRPVTLRSSRRAAPPAPARAGEPRATCARRNCPVIAKTFRTAKSFRSHRANFFRHAKSLRDLGDAPGGRM